jgi:multiple antibiotic resistance protein
VLDDENHLVTQFLTLWVMLDPISHLPLFLAATVDLSRQEKRRAAVVDGGVNPQQSGEI